MLIRATITLGVGLGLVVLFGSTDLMMPMVDDGYWPAIQRAQALPDPHHEVLRQLLALDPIPVWDELGIADEGQPQAFVWVPDDLMSWKLFSDTDDFPRWSAVSYDDLGFEEHGELRPIDGGKLDLRRSLSKGVLSSAVFSDEIFPEPDFGPLPAVWRLSKWAFQSVDHPYRPNSLYKLTTDFFYLLLLLPTILLLILKNTGAKARERVRDNFRNAAKSGNGVIPIAGRRWIFDNGEFYHIDIAPFARPAMQSGHVQRWEFANLCDVSRAGIALFLPFTLVFGGNTEYQELMPGFEVIVPIVSLVIVAWELLYNRGVQWIPGAMVLDPVPHIVTAADVEKQKAFGGGGIADEAASAAAASGTYSQRLPVHDQEF